MELEYDSRKNWTSQMKSKQFFSEAHFAMPFPTVNCQLSTVNWTHTFSAKEKDSETGLSYFGSRYYSSDLSIWLSVDPMSDKYPSLSPYVYCTNNPIKLVDPNGEEIGDLEPHKSLPANPLIADPLFWTGYVDKVGTGTEDIVNLCKEKGLKSPEYHQEEDFRVVIWRRTDIEVAKLSPSCHQVVTKLSSSIPVLFELLKKMAEPMSAKEMREFCGQKDHTYFKKNVINPLIAEGLVTMTHPETPNSPAQKYYLTEDGKRIINKTM